MEPVVVILVIGVVILWYLKSAQGDRLQRTETDVLEIRKRLDRAEAALAGLESQSRPVAGPAPRATTERTAPRAPAARRTLETAPARTRALPFIPAPVETEQAQDRWWVRPAAIQPLPAGPGLIQRVLVRLGMTASEEGDGFSLANVEAWLEGRLLAVVGGIALLLGAVFFLSLAFSRGWITEPMRVLIGLSTGAGLMVLGEVSFTKLRGILGHVLVAVGLAIVSLALLAATRLYGLVPVEWGLAGSFVAAVAAAAIAVRHDSELVAGLGLIAVLMAPPILGASPTLVTLLFVGATLIGTTGVALFRTWVWLPPLAFVLAGPQLASYILGEPATVQALIAIAAFWLVNLVAAGGEEIRHATERLRTTTVTLLLASAAFTVWAGFTVLGGDLDGWRGTFLAVMAVAHLALGLFLLARHGDRHPFGLVVAATGVAALTMAVPVQFGGPPVPIAWAAEAVALTWVAVLRRHPYSAAVAALLGVMALGHLVAIEYPVSSIDQGFTRTWAFAGPEGMTYAFLIAALVVAGLGIPIAWVRAGLTAIGGLLTIYVLPFELSGPALVGAWAAILVIGSGVYVRVVAPKIAGGFAETRVANLALPASIEPIVVAIVAFVSRQTRSAFAGVAALAGIAAIAHVVAFDFPFGRLLGTKVFPGIPYVGPEGMSLAAVLLALAAVAWLLRTRWALSGNTGIGLVLLAYSVTFEVAAPHVAIAWGVIVVSALAVARRISPLKPLDVLSRVTVFERIPYAAAALALLFLIVLAHWYADASAFGSHVTGAFGPAASPFLDERSYVIAIVMVTWLAAGWAWAGTTGRHAGGIGAGLAIAWLLPFEIRTGYAVAGWAMLALAGVAAVRFAPAMRAVLGTVSLALGAWAMLVAILIVAPLHRLLVDSTTTVIGWTLLSDATVALFAIALALGAGAWLHRADPLSRIAVSAAGVTVVYLLSVALVDAFQRQVGSRPLEELQKEAQVGLSVLWSILGGVGFAGGIWRHRPSIRVSGLALLGLATVKVFLVDLAALDVAYRVLSLVALGVLLLVSALAYSRMQHPHPPARPKSA